VAAASAVAYAVGAVPPRGPGHRQAPGRPSSVRLLLLADEDGDGELLLLGELGRDLKGLATVGGLKVVDHPAIVDLAGDLAADTRRRRRGG
jgi:hypothetical protein